MQIHKSQIPEHLLEYFEPVGENWSYEVAEQLANAEAVRYEPKASTAEREAGLDSLETRTRHRVNAGGLENEPRFAPVQAKNHHPTVKPISLTKYLATLLLPPAGYHRRILCPFAGSGSEMIGAILAGWDEVIGPKRVRRSRRLGSAMRSRARSMRNTFIPRPVTVSLLVSNHSI